MFLAALVLMLFNVILFSNGITEKWIVTTINNGILNLGLLQAWVPDKAVYFSFNATSWYLSISIFFYLISPIIFIMIAKLKTHKRLFIALGIIFAIQILWSMIFGNTSFAHAMIYIFPAYRVLEFIIGCIFGKIFLDVISDLNCQTKCNSSIQLSSLV